MSEKSFRREFAEELIGKAVVWGPPLAAGIVLGPAAIIAGAVTAAVVVSSGNSNDGSARSASKANDTGSSP